MINVIAMAMFALIMSITPGPVNLITLNSGLNNGFRQTFAYVSGATIGFTGLLFVIGLGLSSIIMAYPNVINIVKYLGALYMMYLGYIIIKSQTSANTPQIKSVPGFLDGVILQCSNPKAWIACLSGVSAFAKASSFVPLLTFIGIYFVICYICISIWALAGAQLKWILNNEFYKQLVGRCMGGLLIITGISLIL